MDLTRALVFTEREVAGRSLIFVFEWADSEKRQNDDDIFTAKNVQSMCKVEHSLLSRTGKAKEVPDAYVGDSADYTDFCALNYPSLDATSTECKPQQMTPAGLIYATLTGGYSEDCVDLDEDEVTTAALCLFYFYYIDDAEKLKEATEVKTSSLRFCGLHCRGRTHWLHAQTTTVIVSLDRPVLVLSIGISRFSKIRTATPSALPPKRALSTRTSEATKSRLF